MKYLKQSFLYIILSSALLYVIASYLPGFGLSIQNDYSNDLIIYVFIGIVCRLVNFILKGILNLFTLPISFFTFGLFSLILNFILLYVFEQLINYLDVGVVITLGNAIQVFVLSCLFSAICLIVRKI